MKKQIALNSFVMRQVSVDNNSAFGGWTSSPEALLSWIETHVPEKSLQGDIAVIRVKPTGVFFKGTFAIVTAEDKIETKWEARREGEMPVQVRYVKRPWRETPRWVDLVFYSHSRLEAEGEQTELGSDYELVSINCITKDIEGPEPQTPDTLRRNYLAKWADNPYGKGGSYRTKWDDPSVFQKELEEATAYWADLGRVIVDEESTK